MRLVELLSALPARNLDWLALQHGMTSEGVSRATLCSNLETKFRSFAEIQEMTFGRQPPAFAMLTVLFDSAGRHLARPEFSDSVTSLTSRLCDDVTSGEILSRAYEVGIYRRVLYEARRNDLLIDESEAALLAVLRRELGISRVEHYLVEHHADLQEFWRSATCFDKEFEALTTAGLLFVNGDEVFMAEDVAPLVGQALGVELPSGALRRLLAALPSALLAAALEGAGARTSGSKEDRIGRVIRHQIQPSAILPLAGLETLRDLARDSGAKPYGSKEELIQRVIRQFASGGDLNIGEVSAENSTPIAEPRALERERFGQLFGSLRGQELAQILESFPDLRQSGSKEVRVGTLWESNRSEMTLLASLRSTTLEVILDRLDLSTGGPKMVRVERLLAHAATGATDSPSGTDEVRQEAFEPPDPSAESK